MEQNCLSPDAQTTSYQLGHLRQITAFGALVSSSVPISRNVARIKWLVPVKGLEGCCQYVLAVVLVAVTLCTFPQVHTREMFCGLER